MEQLFGKYRAQVEDNSDPRGAGRVKVSSPVLGKGTTAWAEACLPYCRPGHGFFMLPGVGTAVWIEFEEGDPQRPIWTGCLWDPSNPPASASEVSVASAFGSTVRVGPAGVSVTSAAKLDASASMVDVSASAVRMAAPMVQTTGTLQCDTLIANSVVAASYTPGAGNIW